MTSKASPTESPAKDGAKRALVLFSGGQDSTVCLAWALQRFEAVETVGFFYGQAHSVEMTCREKVRAEIARHFPGWASRLGPDHVLDLAELGRISETALTSDMEIEMGENGLPNTFVPGRNLLFLTYAAALGYRRGAQALVGGMCETDYSGYPDCRAATMKAMESALSLGMDKAYSIETPLMWLDKAATWALAEKLGGETLIEIIREQTHTCYRGERTHRHEWGYGCNDCPACALRRQGYEAWMKRQAHV